MAAKERKDLKERRFLGKPEKQTQKTFLLQNCLSIFAIFALFRGN